MLIERILELMTINKITAKQLTSDLELSNSSITDWKKGKGKPSTDAVIKIANYFDVTTDYLLLGKEKRKTFHDNFKSEDIEWLSLIHQLPEKKQIEFKGELKGYLKCLEEASVVADKAPQKTGTDNLGKSYPSNGTEG